MPLQSPKDNLFRRWEELPHHKEQRFIRDGVIDQCRWDRANVRTLFLLKEAYDWKDAQKRWDLAASIRDDKGPKGPSQRLAALWAYAILQANKAELTAFPDNGSADPSVIEAFMSCSLINIKKSGGNKTSKSEDLASYAKRDSAFIQEQIEIIDPHIIICGNVWRETAKTVFCESYPVYDRVHQWRNRYVVDFWHPGNRFPHKLSYYALAALVQNGIPQPYGRRPTRR